MTTLNQARDAVYKRFIAEWVANPGPGELTPYCFDNETLAAVPTWARCSVRSMPGGQETLGAVGNRKYRRRALARIEIYTPPGGGLQPADLLVQVGMTMFEGRSLLGTTVKLYEAQPAEVGLVDEGTWFLSTVQAYFDYEQVK